MRFSSSKTAQLKPSGRAHSDLLLCQLQMIDQGREIPRHLEQYSVLGEVIQVHLIDGGQNHLQLLYQMVKLRFRL
ncbi:hypothetical protein NIG5292_02513 [Nereida ignava]|uniref:Uncharacterized protein n=1 Tax=Nereida ignava TaxID=282199 RepID=A0A0U1NNZ2_9RHOB|nr:hypothetical protein NIG5292_02513 [Nereida ignava]